MFEMPGNSVGVGGVCCCEGFGLSFGATSWTNRSFCFCFVSSPRATDCRKLPREFWNLNFSDPCLSKTLAS
jgi:hypothetical protein